MSINSRLVCILIGLSCCLTGFTQTPATPSTVSHSLQIQIPQVSLVNVIGNSNVKLALQAPIEAGTSITTIDVDSSFWLNYSFIKGGVTQSKNHIYARIANGYVPMGLSLSVYAKPYQGIGLGGFGISVGAVTLGQNEQRVIENISSCFTGTGIGNGHQLVYQLKLDSEKYDLLDFEQSQQVSVVYTISD